jgi:rhodanese-related sulfurtransferase
MMVDDLEPMKDEEIILYCRSGNRSGQACMILDMLGFKTPKTWWVVCWHGRISLEGREVTT